MNMIRLNIHNSREGILTVNKTHLTMITDQVISKGDALLHPQYTRVSEGGVSTFIVDEIEEERKSKGEWISEPSIWRKIKFTKGIVPAEMMKNAGLLLTEEKYENGKMVTKMFLKL